MNYTWKTNFWIALPGFGEFNYTLELTEGKYRDTAASAEERVE